MTHNPTRYVPFLDAVESHPSVYRNFDPDPAAIQPSVSDLDLDFPPRNVEPLEIEHSGGVQSKSERGSLSANEKWSLLLIFFIYFIGALPIGFYSSSVPVLLAEKGESYSNLGFLSLSRLLISFKPLIAPFVDTKYIKAIGRWRTFILPIQYLVKNHYLKFLNVIQIGSLIVLQSFFIEDQIENKKTTVLSLAAIIFTILVCFQEVASAGWTLSLIRREFAAYASAFAILGSYIASVMSQHIFILVTSSKFPHEYFPSISFQQHKGPLLSPREFFLIFGTLIIIATIIIHVFKIKGNSDTNTRSTQKVFTMIKGFYTNPNLRFVCVFLLVWKIGFSPVESVWVYRMIHKGYPKEMLTLLYIAAIPFRIISNCIISAICRKNREMKVLLVGISVLLIENFLTFFMINNFDSNINMNLTTKILMMIQVLGAIQTSMISISLGSFFNRVADKKMGGTYISTLQAIFNLGRHLSNSPFTVISGFGWGYAIILFAIISKRVLKLEELDHKE